MIYNLGILSFLGSFLSKGLDLIPGAVINAIRSLMFTFTIFIYDLIIKLYDMFLALCNVRLLSNDILQELSRRVGYILGVVMLFYVILGFIQLLLNPDAINDGEKGATAIIKKTIIVIVMLGSANFAFELLYQVQVTVVNSNIISRLLLPYSVTPIVNGQESSDNDSSSSVLNNKIFGNLLAEELLSSFYKVEEFDESDISSSADTSSYENCQTVVNNFRNQIINYGSFDLGYTCLNETIVVDFKIDDSTKSDEQETMIVKFNLLLSPLVGLCAVYILVMYCFKVGVRMVQLMFLEIISPMAIVSYLAPKKDTMFNKWKNIYISTYIDVFIRIAIINFAFFLVTTIFSTTGGTGLEFNGTDYSKNDFFIVVMVLSVLTFAKKAPELVGELLPKSASKLGFGASMKEIFGLGAITGGIAGLGIGAAVGVPSALGKVGRSAAIGYTNSRAKGRRVFSSGVIGAVRGAGSAFMAPFRVGSSVVSGAARGMQAGHGAKGQMLSAARAGQQAAAKGNLERAQRVASGSTRRERAGDAVKGFFGIQGGNQSVSNRLTISNNVKSAVENDANVKRLDELKEAYTHSGRTVTAKDLEQFDTARKKLVEAVYNLNTGARRENDDFNLDLPPDVGEFNPKFEVDSVIQNAINDNMRVAGKNLSTYDEFKADNKELKIQNSQTHGGKK